MLMLMMRGDEVVFDGVKDNRIASAFPPFL